MKWFLNVVFFTHPSVIQITFSISFACNALTLHFICYHYINMATKSIKEIYTGTAPHMVGNGFRVLNYIPGVKHYSGNELSPFILLDYNPPFYFPPSNTRRGVGEHPHRGFETVSIAYEGEIEHRDSHGGGGIIKAGEVQWMTAAGGLMHDEFQSEAFTKLGGTQHFIQLWINLPAKHKMQAPKYQAITKEQIGVSTLDDLGTIVRVIAGEHKGVKGPATTYTPINLYDIRLDQQATCSMAISMSHTTLLLVTKGSVMINGTAMAKHMDAVVFENDGETISLKAQEESMVFLISGEPIHEPIARYGPFVMNTKAEILQAMEDVQLGKFGKID